MKTTRITRQKWAVCAAVAGIVASSAVAKGVSDDVISTQRANLEANTDGKGFGPQSPRDIDKAYGTNLRVFGTAPNRSQMNLCNIHFHKNAEHKGGEFTTYAGNGDGKGKNTGYVYDGELSDAQRKAVSGGVCAAKGDPLQSGDTIEVHWVFSSAQVSPGPTLGACLADSTMNPGLRVEGQVFVLANDDKALDFNHLAEVAQVNGYAQAPNIPMNTGEPVAYLGSTTGPSYNEQGSPLQVSWSVRPQVAVVDINSVGKWCEGNVFEEDHAHGVRNLVQNPKLLSPIQ
ncbi:delta-class carbonic anhydrase [Lacimicrobium sp. SS2-24]|uniref:delta-class carbonic anhydrase n=1 Tax=Lacimicrobium sp. SS2-24 TaxID=2005569 RepID=UPI000B4A7545|nr:delta-class carbonic anhydrase [Lacimicrobium sp. SS2-24]